MYDPTGCQQRNGWKQLSYNRNIDDAQRRMRQGQKQFYCTVCERWRWGDRRCQEFKEGLFVVK